jgi:lipid II:glycine glycyltransferase (peptidoglycan interpeptide bridge formation enzyme)
VDQADAAEWLDLLGGFADANIYQTRSYGAMHWSRQQLSCLTLERDGRTVAMAQLRIVRVPLIKTGIAYVRWGPLCRAKGKTFDAETLHQMMAGLKEEYVCHRGLSLRVLPPVFASDPFATTYHSTWSALGFTRSEEARAYSTVRVDLTPSLEVLRKQLNQKWRNCLNGAERNGLNVVQGSTLGAYDRFLAVYREMMVRKSFDTTVDVDEFRRIQEDLPKPLKMQVFLCEREGRVLNAIVVSAIGDTAIYLLGATSDEGLKLKGAYLLQWRAIQWLKSLGCRYYDLGGINRERNPGVYHFKSGFGGQETEQLGTFEMSASRTSAFCVRTGERLQAIVRRLRSSRDRKVPAVANNGNGSSAATRKAE